MPPMLVAGAIAMIATLATSQPPRPLPVDQALYYPPLVLLALMVIYSSHRNFYCRGVTGEHTAQISSKRGSGVGRSCGSAAQVLGLSCIEPLTRTARSRPKLQVTPRVSGPIVNWR